MERNECHECGRALRPGEVGSCTTCNRIAYGALVAICVITAVVLGLAGWVAST